MKCTLSRNFVAECEKIFRRELSNFCFTSTIDEDSYQTIEFQFASSGYIGLCEDGGESRQLYYQLTPFGNRHIVRLKAVHKLI